MSITSTRRAAVAILATTAAAWRQVRALPQPAAPSSAVNAKPEPVVTHHGGRPARLTQRA